MSITDSSFTAYTARSGAGSDRHVAPRPQDIPEWRIETTIADRFADVFGPNRGHEWGQHDGLVLAAVRRAHGFGGARLSWLVRATLLNIDQVTASLDRLSREGQVREDGGRWRRGARGG